MNMRRKPEEDCDCLITGEIKSFLISLQQSGPSSSGSSSNRTSPSIASRHSRIAKEQLQKKRFSAALCTHLGINIGVKGPTAFELFMVYRALGGRKRR